MRNRIFIIWMIGAICGPPFAAGASSNPRGEPALMAGHENLAAGRFQAARIDFETCLLGASTADRHEYRNACRFGLATSHYLLGDLELAEQQLDAMTDSDPGAADLSIRARILRGRLYTAQARYDDALETLSASIEESRKTGWQPGQALSELALAEWALDRRDGEAAQERLDIALEVIAGIQPGEQRTGLTLSAGEIALLVLDGEPDVSPATQRVAAAIVGELDKANQSTGPRVRSQANGLLGTIHLSAGRLDDALSLARLAVFQAHEADAPDLTYRWEWLLGRVLRAQGDLERALAALDRAIAALSRVRSGLLIGLRGRRQPFRALVGPLFQDHADVLLTLSSSEGGDAQALRQRARRVIEAFKSAELQDYFLEECVIEVQERSTVLDQLDATTAVLYPILLADRTELLVSQGGSIHQFTVPVGESRISQTAVQLRRSLERPGTSRFETSARRLYDWLVRPAESVLESGHVDTLVFVPDGALRTIPIGALLDGETFLIQRLALVTTPGLDLTDPRPTPREQPRLLVNALTESVQGYPALPAVDQELQALRTLYGGENLSVLSDGDFIVDNLQRLISEQPFDIVHFASHGVFSADVSESFLLTYREKLTMDQLDEFMRLRRFSEQPVELLTLSACQTAAGDDRAALGLAGLAIKAGARSAVGTLWFISDQASSLVMTRFYDHLREAGWSKAEALRQAQMALMEDRRFAHPGFWAPFLLIGNWL